MNTEARESESMTTTTSEEIQIHWMIRRDMPYVLEIEKQCFDSPWSEVDFIQSISQRNCIHMVAKRNDRIVGFMIYQLFKWHLHLEAMAVGPAYRRMGVGRAMVQNLRSKLSIRRRKRVTVGVPERELDAQLFFRDCGFVAVDIIRSPIGCTDEDIYLMELAAEREVEID